jgi:hypothetical protein
MFANSGDQPPLKKQGLTAQALKAGGGIRKALKRVGKL